MTQRSEEIRQKAREWRAHHDFEYWSDEEVAAFAESLSSGATAPKFGPGDYSCAACGLGMVEPCEHWKDMLSKTLPVDGAAVPSGGDGSQWRADPLMCDCARIVGIHRFDDDCENFSAQQWKSGGESAPEPPAHSSTWGDLPGVVQDALGLLPHEWDNKTVSEQRDFLIEMVSNDYAGAAPPAASPQLQRMQANKKREGTPHAVEHEQTIACHAPPRCQRAASGSGTATPSTQGLANVRAMRSELASLKAGDGWILASEKMPEDSRRGVQWAWRHLPPAPVQPAEGPAAKEKP